MALPFPTACSDHDRRRFDPVAWRTADTLGTRVRAEMLDDLLRPPGLEGATRAQLLARLGPPTATNKFRDWSMVYIIGPAGLDYEWLVIRLDKAGRAVETRVLGD